MGSLDPKGKRREGSLALGVHIPHQGSPVRERGKDKMVIFKQIARISEA